MKISTIGLEEWSFVYRFIYIVCETVLLINNYYFVHFNKMDYKLEKIVYSDKKEKFIRVFLVYRSYVVENVSL